MQAAKSQPRPQYKYLRFEEDYSYLGESDFRGKAEFFDPIKYVPLGANAWLQAGGELRLRYEEETNKFLAPGPQPADGFLLSRLALHLDLQFRDRGRLFVEGIHGDVYDRDQRLFFIHRNRLDLHQLFFDVEVGPAVLRLGRQEMAYGSEHVISASGWGRMRKRFDAVKVHMPVGDWQLSAWYAKPVISETESADRQNRDVSFAGAYLSGVAGIDVYYFFQNDERLGMNPNGEIGKQQFHVLGTRYAKRKGPWDVELELNSQLFGDWAGQSIRAWSAGGQAGYSFLESMRRPRIGFGFELASGDDDPTDGVVNTYQQLYRQEKDHLGYLVMFGRQNVRAFNVNARIGLIPRKVLLEAFYYWFSLQSDSDALYNPGAIPLPGRRDPLGNSGRSLGRELDLVLGWQVNRHHSLLIGYLHFWNGGFVQATGDVKAPGNAFVQYKMLF